MCSATEGGGRRGGRSTVGPGGASQAAAEKRKETAGGRPARAGRPGHGRLPPKRKKQQRKRRMGEAPASLNIFLTVAENWSAHIAVTPFELVARLFFTNSGLLSCIECVFCVGLQSCPGLFRKLRGRASRAIDDVAMRPCAGAGEKNIRQNAAEGAAALAALAPSFHHDLLRLASVTGAAACVSVGIRRQDRSKCLGICPCGAWVVAPDVVEPAASLAAASAGEGGGLLSSCSPVRN